MSFRPAISADIERITALWRTCGLTRPWNPPHADIAMAVQADHADVLIAEENAALAATIMVGQDGHRAWVYYVAVDPAHRRKGWGRRAMAEAERWAEDRKLPKLQLMVRETNAEVLGFYSALGYADQATRVLGKWLDPQRARIFEQNR